MDSALEALTVLSLGFDGLLGLSLLWLAWQLLVSEDLFRAVVLFIAFGLLMALAWVRLEAPDIALAEAAIGAGLSGALLLAALARLTPPQEIGSESAASRWLALLVVLPVAVGLAYVILSLVPQADGLALRVADSLPQSGVGNPVTAVLLNFRGYDTLLEMMVLLLALLGVWTLGESADTPGIPASTILNTLAAVLTPLLLLVAAYMLWVGADAPGGAFQAGSVLAAAGVLLLLAGWRPGGLFRGWILRLILVLGPAVFVLMALITLLMQGQLLQYPPAQAGLPQAAAPIALTGWPKWKFLSFEFPGNFKRSRIKMIN